MKIKINIINNRPPLERVILEESPEDYMVIIGDNGVGKSILLQELSKSNGMNIIFNEIEINLPYFYYISSHRDYNKNISDNTLRSQNNIPYKTFTNNNLHQFELNQYLYSLILENNDLDLSEIKNIFDSLLYPKELIFNIENIENDNRRIYFKLKKEETINISIDKLSSGELEIFNIAIELYKNIKQNTIIFIDEPEIHLNPLRLKDFLEYLVKFSKNRKCYLIIVTHSIDIIANTPLEHLIRMIQYNNELESQLIQLNSDNDLIESYINIAGHFSYIPFKKKIVFCEGNIASLDKKIYDIFLSTLGFKEIIIIPADNKNIISGLNDKILKLLTSEFCYNFYYTISDRDYDRNENNNKIFKLKRYHIENYLVEEEYIYRVLNDYFKINFKIEDLKSLIEKYIIKNKDYFITLKINNFLVNKNPKINYLRAKNNLKFDEVINNYKEELQNYAKSVNEFTQINIKDLIERFYKELLVDWKENIPGREILKGLTNYLKENNKIKLCKNKKFPNYNAIKNNIIDYMVIDKYVPDDIRKIFSKINIDNNYSPS